MTFEGESKLLLGVNIFFEWNAVIFGRELVFGRERVFGEHVLVISKWSALLEGSVFLKGDVFLEGNVLFERSIFLERNVFLEGNVFFWRGTYFFYYFWRGRNALRSSKCVPKNTSPPPLKQCFPVPLKLFQDIPCSL